MPCEEVRRICLRREVETRGNTEGNVVARAEKPRNHNDGLFIDSMEDVSDFWSLVEVGRMP
jgi:hypothetical protein